jgi:hypothetical protein
MKKFALSIVIAAAAIFGSGVAAQASTYPPSSIATVAAGGTFDATINGCTPPEIVTFLFEGVSKTAPCLPGPSSLRSAAATVGTGTASVTFDAPSVPGNYVATATGSAGFRGSDSISVTAVGVTPAAPVAPITSVTPAAPVTPLGGLPATGADGISTMTTIAIGFFVVGGGLLVVSQLRRRRTVPA